jgi:hypothetical protein
MGKFTHLQFAGGAMKTPIAGQEKLKPANP